ncbi:class I SAM-dependent methyltransferase [Tenacibaculum amylolyticum]|uniref:class I SAM-dependent methyltransferase n=1 Tax=Tenacibaculum amylolyticum TaxID=104269 RepID=UPI0038964764
MRSFFTEAVKTIKTSGTIRPSSKYLIQNCLDDLNFKNANLILEFGTGNGCITEQILNKMNENSILISFETNKVFYEYCKEKFKNTPQLIILNESAFHFPNKIANFSLLEPDLIISSLPLQLFEKTEVLSFIVNIHNSLRKNGTFVQYQYSLGVYKKLQYYFKKVTLRLTLLNLPPAFVFKCLK